MAKLKVRRSTGIVEILDTNTINGKITSLEESRTFRMPKNIGGWTVLEHGNDVFEAFIGFNVTVSGSGEQHRTISMPVHMSSSLFFSVCKRKDGWIIQGDPYVSAINLNADTADVVYWGNGSTASGTAGLQVYLVGVRA